MIAKRLTAAVTALSLLVPYPATVALAQDGGASQASGPSTGAGQGTDSAADGVAEALERAGITRAGIEPDDCALYNEASLRESVNDYIAAHRRYGRADASSSRIRVSLEVKKVRCAIFRNPGSEEYLEGLRYIDSLASRHAEAIYDLATKLQLYWESEYGGTLLARGASRVNTGAKAGLASAVLVLGTVLAVRRPRNAADLPRRMSMVRKYFKAIRSLKPAQALRGAAIGVTTASAGTAGGAVIADQLHRSGLFDGDIPPAPAHVMGLGFPMNEFIYDYEYDDLIEDLISYGAGATAGLAVVTAAKWVNRAITPAKIHPVVLIASFVVVDLIVANLVENEIEESHHNGLKEKVYGSRNILDWGVTAGNDAYTYMGADGLVRSTINLASYYNKDLLSAIEEYMGDVSEAAEDHGESSPAFQRRLDEITPEFSERVREILRERRFAFNADYEAYLVRSAMAKGDAEMIRGMGPSAVQLARYYLNGFENWYLAHRQELEQICYAQDRRRQAFRFYLKSVDDAADRAMAQEFRWEGARRDPNMVLMQAAAFIRATKKPYLEYQAATLMGMIEKNMDIIQSVVGANAGERGLPL